MQEPVLQRRERGALLIQLNRPDKLNAMNLRAWKLLAGALSEGCTGDYTAVILTGSGRAFSAGDDIYEMASFKSLDEARSFFNQLSSALDELALCSRPIIAAVNGIAAGGGAEILLLADIVIAARGSWLWFPEARIGLIPPILSTLGAYSIGSKRARYLAIAMPRISAEEAKNLGLVDLVVDPKDLLETAFSLAEELGNLPPAAIRTIRRLTLQPILHHLHKALEELATLSVSEDAKKRMNTFIESRRSNK